ncbi:MAG TPA: hypothetical protein VFR84_16720 [Candidatus Angelobacter sp.]|nr:hypothetical protein [Candidatus Angelobacter sp.]
MTEHDLQLLKANIDKTLRIRFRDGETSLIRVNLISDEDRDVIYDLISTDKESTYEKLDVQPAYRAEFDDIVSVEAVETEER